MKTKDLEIVEKLIYTATNSYIENKELEIRESENVKKLNLWIVSLTTAIELFLINTISYSEIRGFTKFLYISTVAIFIYNSIIGLYIAKMVVNSNNLESKYQRYLNEQRISMINVLNTHSDIRNNMLDDFYSEKLTEKIKQLHYYKQLHPLEKVLNLLGKGFNNYMEGSLTIALMIQFVAAALIFFMN